ncbi:hypothetical protein [Azospirillum argentinense]
MMDLDLVVLVGAMAAALAGLAAARPAMKPVRVRSRDRRRH